MNKKEIVRGVLRFFAYIFAIVAICAILVEEVKWRGVILYAVGSAICFIIAGFFKRKTNEPLREE